MSDLRTELNTITQLWPFAGPTTMNERVIPNRLKGDLWRRFNTSFGGVVTTWNAAAERMFGHTAHDIVGWDLRHILALAKEHAPWQRI